MNFLLNFVYKLRNHAVTSGLYFLYLFASCVLTMLVEALLIFFIDKIIVLEYFPATVIRIVIYTVGVPAIIAVLGYFEGYKDMKYSIGEVIVPYIPAAVLHLLFAMLFKFQGFVSGSVRFTAGLIANGADITYDSLLNVTPYWIFLAVFAAYEVLYCLVFLLAKYFGVQKHIIFRGELRKGEVSPQVTEHSQQSQVIPHVSSNDDVSFDSTPVVNQEQQPHPYSQPAHDLAVASLVCSIICFFLVGAPLSIVAIVCAAMARHRGNTEGITTAGLVCGIVALVLSIVLTILLGFLNFLILS